MRSELDTLEGEVPDLERQIRAAQVAVDDEEAEAKAKGGPGPAAAADDPELRERIELRERCSVGRYVLAAMRGKAVDGAEAELQQAIGGECLSNGGIPFELWQAPRA